MPQLVIVQSGSFEEAWIRLKNGGPENYRDQRWSVDFVESLSADFNVTTVSTSSAFQKVELSPSLSALGLSPESAWDRCSLPRVMSELRPDLLLLRLPNRDAVAWASRARVQTLPTFANMFYRRSIWERYRLWRLRIAALNAPCFCNHTLNASRSVQDLGVSNTRIVPWEFRRVDAVGEAKEAPSGNQLRAFYAGSVSASKGVTDCIEACGFLNARGCKVSLTVAGSGDLEDARQRARKAGIESHTHFLGSVASETVRSLMREHDVVIVPSRHEFAEGLPNTIYEALASRTPLIASDHPSFADRLAAGRGSLQFPAGDSQSLAEQIQRVAEDRDLYRQLSEMSATVLDSLYVGIEWTELVRRFLDDPENSTGWVEPISLASVDPARTP